MTRSVLLMMTLVVVAAWPAGAQTQLGPKALPGARPSALPTIRGRAVKSTNGQLSNATVRLRDVRFGRIVDTQIVDKTGSFAFKAVNPGNYVVEVLGPDRAVLAATPLLNVDAGQDLPAVVISVPPFVAALRSSTPSAAAIITSAAAASGVLATAIAGEPVSPGK